MKIAMLQIQVQEDVKANLNQVQTLALQSRKEGADILVLPEMWNCPYINEQIKKSVSSYDLCQELLQTLSDK
ncbi:nitrilase-related carbon-nitrogen hydrolase, partial [uncultured Faecalicoccus sp.]